MNGNHKNYGKNWKYLAWERKSAVLLQHSWRPVWGQRDVIYSISFPYGEFGLVQWVYVPGKHVRRTFSQLDKRPKVFMWPNSPYSTAPVPFLPLLTTICPKSLLSNHTDFLAQTLQTASTLVPLHMQSHLPKYLTWIFTWLTPCLT